MLLTFLWNRLVPTLLNGPTIAWWQALGLLALVKLLIVGWQKRLGARQRRARKKRFTDCWNRMTPQERARFKQQFDWCCRKWGCVAPEPETNALVDKVKVR
jgi:hypothetical protein